MGSINNGGQLLTYDYRQTIKSQDFNRLNYKLHPSGIYEGGTLIKVNDAEVRLQAFTCLYEDEDNSLSIRITTTTDATVSVSPSTPFIIGRFSWLNTENNFMDLVSVSFEDILDSDIIFGQLFFEGSILSPTFDYSKTTYCSKKILKLTEQFPFRIYPTIPPSNQVEVDVGGPIYVDGKKIEVTTKTLSPTITLPTSMYYRKDFITMNTSTGAIVIFTGVEDTIEANALFPIIEKGYFVIGALIFGNTTHSVIRGSDIQYIHPNEVKTSYYSPSQVLPMITSLDGASSGLDSYALDSVSHVDLKTSLNPFFPTYSGSMPVTAFWKGIANNGTTFSAVAFSSSIAATSTDGLNWTQRAMPSSANWNGIAYGNGTFVAVAGSSDKAATSIDGITWTPQTLPSSTNWWAITYGSGMFIAIVYNSNVAATSTDGITWTPQTLPSTTTWQSIEYGNGVFIAVASTSSTSVARSTDGVNWTLETLPVAISCYDVAYNNGIFAILGNNSSIAVTSPDGITWTQRTLPVSTTWKYICSGGGLFFGVSETDAATSSLDGITWFSKTMPESTTAYRCLDYKNGRFIVPKYGTATLCAGDIIL